MKVFAFFFFFFFMLPASPVFAETARSNCVVTKVGNPLGEPALPATCQQDIGLQLPPDLGPCFTVPEEKNATKTGEYCQLPPAAPKSTRRVFYTGNLYEKRMQSNKWQDWGSKEMISVLYTISYWWKNGHTFKDGTVHAGYPQGHVILMDITSDYHLSHFWGIAVDVFATTNQSDCAASFGTNWRCPYGPINPQATVNLGKMIVDTGYFNTVWFNGDRIYDTLENRMGCSSYSRGVGACSTINGDIFDYAKSVDPSRFTTNTSGRPGIRPLPGHDDHFHLNIYRNKLKDCRSSGVPRAVCFP